MKKIAVLGANGFIGSKIVKVLSDNKEIDKVVSINKDNYKKHLEEHFDVFINANGNSRKWWAAQNPKEDFKASVSSVASTLQDFSFDKYVYLSSVDVYNTDSIYGKHKSLAEAMLVNYLKDTLLVLRLGAVIGKEMKKGVLFDAKDTGKLYVTEDSTFQFVTNTEVANCINEAINNNNFWGTCLDLLSEDSLRAKDLEEILGKKLVYGSIVQNYNIETYIGYLYPIKTAREYVEEIVNGHN